jgi:hypothetical protein
MLWKRVTVHEQERVVVIKNSRPSEILAPGDHWIFVAPGASLHLERHDMGDLVFQSNWADYLIRERSDLVERYFILVETNEVQVAMVYVDGKLVTVLTPAKSVLLWRGLAEVSAEVVDLVEEPEMPADMLLELERGR